MDHEALARELVRVMRGKRSQPWLSRRLGLRSNLVYRWEAGRAFPTAMQFFRICRLTKTQGSLDFERFLGGEWRLDLETQQGVGGLLKRLAGAAPVSEIAKELGQSRFVVSRWLTGKTQIRLPELLGFIQATTRRLLDFLSVYLDPGLLASAAREWKRLQAARQAAYEVPWSHGVLRALELRDYAQVTGDSEAWVGARLGLPRAEVVRALALLRQSGQVKRYRGRFRVVRSELVDTGVDQQRRQTLRSFWTRVALEQLDQGAQGIHAFNLFTIAENDIPQIRAWHTELFERIRGLISKSSPAERVMLYSAQILTLDQS